MSLGHECIDGWGHIDRAAIHVTVVGMMVHGVCSHVDAIAAGFVEMHFSLARCLEGFQAEHFDGMSDEKEHDDGQGYNGDQCDCACEIVSQTGGGGLVFGSRDFDLRLRLHLSLHIRQAALSEKTRRSVRPVVSLRRLRRCV